MDLNIRLNRLLKYGDLLAKGASEAQRIISENYDAKSKITESIKRAPFAISHFRAERAELVELIKKDKEIFERVKRWVESKESNRALKMLEDGMYLKLSPKLIKILSNIIEFNKKDHKILMKLGKLLDKQEELTKETKLQSPEFVKMFEKSLKRQHKYFEELNYYGTKRAGILKTFLNEARVFSFIFSCNIAWTGYDHFQAYLETGDVSQLELFKGSIVIIITATILVELLQGLELIPQFTKPAREYFSKHKD